MDVCENRRVTKALKLAKRIHTVSHDLVVTRISLCRSMTSQVFPGCMLTILLSQLRPVVNATHRGKKEHDAHHAHSVATSVNKEAAQWFDKSVRQRPMYIQYGVSRTATTLQFETLCAMSCLMLGKDTQCTFGNCEELDKNRTATDPPIICKTHSRSQVISGLARGCRVSVTGQDPEYEVSHGWRPTAKAMEYKLLRHLPQQNLSLPSAEEVKRRIAQGSFDFVAVVEALSIHGDMLLPQYADIFGLSEEITKNLHSFLRHWDKLRLCCGAQMSESWRLWLHESAEAGRDLKASQRSYPTTPVNLNHTCASSDLGAIERRWLGTAVVTKCLSIPRIAQLSSNDAPMDGGYCEWANAMTKQHKLGFNDKYYSCYPNAPGSNSEWCKEANTWGNGRGQWMRPVNPTEEEKARMIDIFETSDDMVALKYKLDALFAGLNDLNDDKFFR